MTEHEKKIGTVLKCSIEGKTDTLVCSCGNTPDDYDDGGSFIPVDKYTGKWEEGDFNEYDFLMCKRCGAIIYEQTLVIVDYATVS